MSSFGGSGDLRVSSTVSADDTTLFLFFSCFASEIVFGLDFLEDKLTSSSKGSETREADGMLETEGRRD